MASEKLQVILELVTSDYTREAKEAATATDKIGGSARSATGSLGAMLGPAAIGGAILGLGKLAMAAGENADRLFDLAAQTGLSTDELQEWEFVAKAAGAETEVFSDAVKAIIKNLDENAGATGAAAKAYATLGINVKDASGSLRDAGAITDEVFAKLAGMSNITERNALAQDLFGKKWEETISILDLGTEALGNLKDEASGAIVDEEALKNADEFRETMDKLKAVLGAQLNRAIGAIAPLLTDVAESAKDVMDELEPLLEGLGWLSEQFGNAREKGAEMAQSDNVVEAGWGRMIGELGVLNVLTGNYTSAIEGAIGATDTNVTSTDAMTGSWHRATVAIDGSTAALDENVAALAAADDAELSMLRAEEKVIEARENLIRVTNDATASTDEKRIAQLELNIAVANARVRTDEYKASLEALDGTQSNVTIVTTLQTFQAKESIEEAQNRGSNTSTIGKFAAGGVVPGRIGEPMLAVVHGGETIIPAGGGSITNSGATINVYSPSNNLAQDIQYATILATVTTLVEVQN